MSSYQIQHVEPYIVSVEYAGNVIADEVSELSQKLSAFTTELGYVDKSYVLICDVDHVTLTEFDMRLFVQKAQSPIPGAIVVIRSKARPLIMSMVKALFSITKQKVLFVHNQEEALNKARTLFPL